VALLEGLGWANLRVIRHANTGKGGAVQRGVLEANGDWVLFADADNSTPIEEFSRLLAANAPVAIASRHGFGAREANKSALRQLVSNILRFVLGTVSGLNVRDTQCGFKLFRRDAARRLFSVQRLHGFSFDLEVLFLARHYGLEVAEVPVEWFDAPGSKVNALRDTIRFFKDMLEIRRNARRGLYTQEA
jgi:dolichyl-phosphate beta-glucosyltransferase